MILNENRKIKVLVITYSTWREDTNLGNSFSNIFKGLDDKMEFAHIYFKDSIPQNTLVHKYFQISEKGLFKSILTRKPVGRKFELKDPYNTSTIEFSSMYNAARSLRWESIFLVRDYLPLMGRWKTRELDQFITDFAPDLIFGNLHFIPIVNKILTYASAKFNIPLVLYPWDDFYSLKRISFSPIFWLRFFLERPAIKKCAMQCEYMYAITRQMQLEYKRYFGVECKILYKGYPFDGYPPVKKRVGDPIRLLYMGNIGSGRWKVLGTLASELAKINIVSSQKVELSVYTLSPHTYNISKAINIEGTSMLKDPVSIDKVEEIRNDADILVHVEPTSLKDKYFYRLSFSTKLVDYFYNARCVLAIGGNTSAMDYLRDNDAAIVETNPEKFSSAIKKLICNSQMITEYAYKAWDCGKRNHRIEDIQRDIYNDFSSLAFKNK